LYAAATIHKRCNNTIEKWQAYALVNLILKKISKIGATRCQILRLKCTKIDFDWGSAPDRLGELTVLPLLLRSPAVFKGPTSKGKEGEGEERREGRREGRGNDRTHSLSQIPGNLRKCLIYSA